MPLFVRAKAKLSANDTMNLMRTHFEDTWFDNRGVLSDDVGAESGNSAYRWRPLTWTSNGAGYVRAAAAAARSVLHGCVRAPQQKRSI